MAIEAPALIRESEARESLLITLRLLSGNTTQFQVTSPEALKDIELFATDRSDIRFLSRLRAEVLEKGEKLTANTASRVSTGIPYNYPPGFLEKMVASIYTLQSTHEQLANPFVDKVLRKISTLDPNVIMETTPTIV